MPKKERYPSPYIGDIGDKGLGHDIRLILHPYSRHGIVGEYSFDTDAVGRSDPPLEGVPVATLTLNWKDWPGDDIMSNLFDEIARACHSYGCITYAFPPRFLIFPMMPGERLREDAHRADYEMGQMAGRGRAGRYKIPVEDRSGEELPRRFRGNPCHGNPLQEIRFLAGTKAATDFLFANYPVDPLSVAKNWLLLELSDEQLNAFLKLIHTRFTTERRGNAIMVR